MEKGVAVRVELCCDHSKKTELKTISLPKFPSTFRAIKERVEENYSIPACVQIIWYQSEEVPDSCNPASLYMRSGDVVRITFPQTGECHRVKSVVKWLKEAVPLLGRCVAEDAEGMEAICHDYADILGGDSANLLSRELFYPWTNKSKRVNCSHFISLNGIEYLVDTQSSFETERIVSMPSTCRRSMS